MKKHLKNLKNEIPWIGDFFILLSGIVVGGFVLWIIVRNGNWTWKTTAGTLFGSFVLIVWGCLVAKSIFCWCAERTQDLSPEAFPLNLSAERLRERFREIRKNPDADATLSENRALCSIDGFDMDVHLLKESWCASVGMHHGGILKPSQLRRIAKETPVKLPARFLSDEFSSCVVCWRKGELSVYPGAAAQQVREDLVSGLLSESTPTFAAWLKTALPEEE